MPSAQDRATELLDAHGQTFAAELGLRVERNAPMPLFGLLVASMLLASRIQHRLAVQAALQLRSAGLTTARKLAEADPSEVWSALDRGDYLRKERTTAMLGDLARECVERYEGDLRRLRAEADGDVGELDTRLRGFKGIGPTGAEIFLREVQVAWPEVAPYYGSRGLEAARALGLPSDPPKLAELGDPARLGAALVRSQLSDG